MENKTSITALMSAFARAYHTKNQKEPIFADNRARELMTNEEYDAIGNYILRGIDFFAQEKNGAFKDDKETLEYLVNTQIAPTPIARGRFCEDTLKTAMITGTQQYVILGAGMDTFPFREPKFMEKYSVFEVDHPLTQEEKLRRIKNAGWKIPENLHYVPVDFSKDNLEEKLIKSGFDRTKKTFFSWLGVSYYLSLEEINSTLESIAGLSAEGSSLVFDYADENLFSSKIKRVQNMIAMACAGGEPMKSCFSITDISRILEKHRFLIYEHMNTQEIQEKYFRGKGNYLSAFEHINFINAVIK